MLLDLINVIKKERLELKTLTNLKKKLKEFQDSKGTLFHLKEMSFLDF